MTLPLLHECPTRISTYPEVQVQVSTASKLPIADLESDSHPVVGVQHLVEALARVRSELHVMRIAEHDAGEKHQQGIEDACHDGGVQLAAVVLWMSLVVV